jgi:hypothetical protein
MCPSSIIFVSAETGEILLTRTYGGTLDLSLLLVGPLNGVHVFAEQNGAQVISAECGQLKIMWKTYEDKIKMITMTNEAHTGNRQLSLLMEYIFHSLVMLVGLNEVTDIEIADKWRHKLEAALPLVDQLMKDEVHLFCHHTNTADAILPSENIKIVKECLRAFTEMAQTGFGCVMMGGMICTATESWLKLDPVESGLLSHLVVSGFADFTMCADVPVYLPVRSSRVPHRLVAFRLFGTCTVCLLLGPEPPLHTLISQVTRYWDIVYDSLRAEEQFYLHGSCEDGRLSDVHTCVGCLMVNLEKKYSLFCNLTDQSKDKELRKTLDARKCLSEFINVFDRTCEIKEEG